MTYFFHRFQCYHIPVAQSSDRKATNMSATQEASPKTREVIGLTKMSVNAICGKAGRGRICVIAGKATGIKTGEDADGKIWSALIGTFQGTDLKTGETYRSGKLFLPSGIHEPIEAAVKQIGDSGGTVNFAVEFRRVEASNPIGYSYQAVNLLPMESQQDVLSDLLGAIHNKMTELMAGAEPKQLEAGSESAKETPKPQPVAANKKR
jgi:hypothetical protein